MSRRLSQCLIDIFSCLRCPLKGYRHFCYVVRVCGHNAKDYQKRILESTV